MTYTGLVTFGWIDLVCDNCAAGVNAGSCAKASGATSITDVAVNPKANTTKVTTLSFLPSLDIPKAKKNFFIKVIVFVKEKTNIISCLIATVSIL